MSKISKGLIFLITSIVFSLYVTDTTYLLRAVRTTYFRGQKSVGIYDYTVQATRTVHKGKTIPWELHPQYNKLSLSDSVINLHKKLNTTAFIIVKNGKLFFEEYYNEGHKENLSGVWSVSKTYTALLILKAIDDGLIDDINDPVTKYVPEFDVKQQSPLTLRHLCSMSTGLYWDELDQTPFSLIAKTNFYGNLEQLTLNDLYAIGEPGKKQHYDSGGMQLLGTVLKRVLNGKSITDYLSEKLWQPLGAEYDAKYILDSNQHKNEKTFAGLVATARDISRLGVAIADSGHFHGKQILSPVQMQMLTTVPFNNKTYAFGIWTGLHQGKRFYYQSGHLGQFCISFPSENLVITRLGHKNLKKADLEDVSKETYLFIDEALRIINEAATKPEEVILPKF